MPLLLLFCMALVPGLQTQSSNDWEPAPFLQDGETLYACAGDSVEFAWRLNPQGSLRNVQDIKFLHQNKESFLKFKFSNSDRIASINIRENKPEAVLTSQEEKYRGRIGVIDRVMTIRRVRVADSGLYSMVVKGQDRVTGAERVVTSIVTLVVADDIMTTDKGLHISESDTAVFNQTTGRHHKVLECGQFTYNTQPPFDVVWTVPGRGLTHSTEYRVSDGRFRLVLQLPMRTGSYGCSVTKDNAARACAKQLVQDRMSLDATDTRFWLLEKDLAHVQKKIENKIEINNATTLQAFEKKTADLEKEVGDLKDNNADLKKEVGHLKVKNLAMEERANRTQMFLAYYLEDKTPAHSGILKFKHVKPGSEGYDSSSGHFVAKYDGSYLVTCSMIASTTRNSHASPHLSLYKDGDRYLDSYTRVDHASDYNVLSLSAAVQLRKGQKLSIRSLSSYMKIHSYSYSPIFSAVLVHSN